jgi:2-methylcitrate dehydratase PrpD
VQPSIKSNVTEKIATVVSQTRYEDLPREASSTAKNAIIDYLGVALAASSIEPVARIVTELARELEAKPEAEVIGGGFKTSTSVAALTNGVIGHALDYDDTIPSSEGYNCHPTVAILPPLLALAEQHKLSGKDILAAYIVGFEVQSRIGSAIGKYSRDMGWHSTSTIGSLAAAAAASNMLKLNVQESRVALGIAASLASGLLENIGTMTKALHAGNAARNGVEAAILAQKGFTANCDILEGCDGFCSIFSGREVSDLAKLEQGLGSRWAIVTSGIGFKPYPCCRASHSAINAMLKLRKEYDFVPEEVVAVTCKIDPTTPLFLKYHQPKTPLEAKFSLEYCVALAMLDEKVYLEQFSQEKVCDPKMQGLVSKIKYVHPDGWPTGSERLTQEVTVKLQDNTEYSCKVSRPRGEPQNPMSSEELLDKFRQCAHLALNSMDTERVLDLLLDLESVSNISELMGISG